MDSLSRELVGGTMAVLFIAPEPTLALRQKHEFSKNVGSRDGGIYILEKIFRSQGIHIQSADSQLLTWEAVKLFHTELANHLIQDGESYPNAENNFSELTVGEWTRLVVSCNASSEMKPLQEIVHRMRGGTHYYKSVEPDINLPNGSTIKPMRAILGDRNVVNNNWWPVPVGYNFLHVPDNAREAIQTNIVWNQLKVK